MEYVDISFDFDLKMCLNINSYFFVFSLLLQIILKLYVYLDFNNLFVWLCPF